MGNIFSESLKFESYKWSSAQFPEEYALVYTLLTDETKFNVFRLSVNKERVLCRLANYLCSDHPVRLHIEFTIEKENGDFTFDFVRLIASGIPEHRIPLCNQEGFSYICRFGGCEYAVTRIEENICSSKNMSWVFYHSYGPSLKSKIRYYVNVECDKTMGISARFSGPYKFKGIVLEEQLELPIQHVKGKPPELINEFVEREFIGKEYILLQPGKGNISTAASGRGTRTINNRDGRFYGNGHGSTYTNCEIVMYQSEKNTRN